VHDESSDVVRNPRFAGDTDDLATATR
jgi:hypothetical protein